MLLRRFKDGARIYMSTANCRVHEGQDLVEESAKDANALFDSLVIGIANHKSLKSSSKACLSLMPYKSLIVAHSSHTLLDFEVNMDVVRRQL